MACTLTLQINLQSLINDENCICMCVLCVFCVCVVCEREGGREEVRKRTRERAKGRGREEVRERGSQGERE